MSDEVLYGVRINKHGSLVLTKWDGHGTPVDTYTITQRGKGKCDCFGSYRSGNCKHRVIAQRLANLQQGQHMDLLGGFYDYDRDIFYTPEDGEGIPLEGAVDIKTMARIQGTIY